MTIFFYFVLFVDHSRNIIQLLVRVDHSYCENFMLLMIYSGHESLGIHFSVSRIRLSIIFGHGGYDNIFVITEQVGWNWKPVSREVDVRQEEARICSLLQTFLQDPPGWANSIVARLQSDVGGSFFLQTSQVSLSLNAHQSLWITMLLI